MLATMLEKFNLTEGTLIEMVMEEKGYERIGKLVVDDFKNYYEEAITAASVCRRRFKASDIALLVILDEEEKGEAGVAFTQTGIFHWKEEEAFIGGISYDQIQSLDYDEENVMVTDKNGAMLIIWCGGDDENKYTRYMYNFIMDIKEYAEENGTE